MPVVVMALLVLLQTSSAASAPATHAAAPQPECSPDPVSEPSRSETLCPDSLTSLLLLGTVGDTVALLAQETLGAVRVGTLTFTKLTATFGRNMDDLQLWLHAAYLAFLGYTALAAAGTLLVAVAYNRRRR